MTTATRQRRTPLGLLPDRPAPRLYDRIIDVLRFRVDEVSRVMSHLGGDKWLIPVLLYGGGLRLLEGLRLRVKY